MNEVCEKDSILNGLLRQATAQGFITHEQILACFPNPEQDSASLEWLFARLHVLHIPVYETCSVSTLPPAGKPNTHLAAQEEEPDLDPSDEYTEDEEIDSTVTDTISLYFREMSQCPLLTLEEEKTLTRAVAEGRLAELRLADGDLEDEEVRRPLLQMVQRGELARDRIIRANTRLVVSVAKRYAGRGVPFSDLIQEGNLGLMRAVSKFDYRRGYKFSTYATWWIRQAITRALADQGRTIRLPVHMGDRLRRLFRISRELEQELGRPPTSEEIAARLGLTAGRVQWMLRISTDTLSLQKPVGEDEESELGHFIEDEDSLPPGDVANQLMLREKLEQLLDTLSPRQARILRLRFGLADGHVYTLEEVGRKFGVTRERIRQIEAQALGRLRHPHRSRQLKGFL